ncbi:unnamed protein product, partial [Brassica oleracea]
LRNQQDKVEANVFEEMTALGAKERKLYQILYSKFPVYTIPPTMFFGFAIGPGGQFDQNRDLQKIWIALAQVLESGKGGAIFGSSESFSCFSTHCCVWTREYGGVSM